MRLRMPDPLKCLRHCGLRNRRRSVGWSPRSCAAIVDRLTFARQIAETGSNCYRLAHGRSSVDGISHGTGSLTFIAECDLDPDGHLRLTNNRQAHSRHRLAAKQRTRAAIRKCSTTARQSPPSTRRSMLGAMGSQERCRLVMNPALRHDAGTDLWVALRDGDRRAGLRHFGSPLGAPVAPAGHSDTPEACYRTACGVLQGAENAQLSISDQLLASANGRPRCRAVVPGRSSGAWRFSVRGRRRDY